MAYVSVDTNGNITGVFANPQTAFDTAYRDDSDPAIIAFLTATGLQPLLTRQAQFESDATRSDLISRLRTATPAQLNSYVDATVTDLASARALLKRILLVLGSIA